MADKATIYNQIFK